MSSRAVRWTLAGILLASLLVRVVLAWRPIAWLLDRLLFDDAFYQSVVARHLIAGHGSTADGQSLADGYNLMWMALCLPFYALAGENRDLPLHLTLCLASVIDVLGGYLLYRLALRLTNSPWTGVLACLLYLLPVGALRQALNGIETSLASVALMGLSLCWLHLAQGEARLRSWGLFGLALGLAIITRSDIGLLAPFFALAAVWRYRSRWRHGLLRGAILGGAATTIAGPWFLWCWIKTGHFVQTSGLAAALIFHRQVEAWGYERIPAWLWWRRSLVTLGQVLEAASLHTPILPLLLGLAIGVGWTMGRPLRPLLQRAHSVWPVVVLPIGVIIVDAFVRWDTRPWHLGPLFVALALITALAIEALLRCAKRSQLAGAALAVLLFGPLAQQYVTWWRIITQYERHFPAVAAFRAATDLAVLEAKYPRGTALGFTDSGYLSYYARHLTIVNLDGVINADVYRALEQHDMMGYIRRTKIRAYLLRGELMNSALLGERFFAESNFDDIFVEPAARPSTYRQPVTDVLHVDRWAGLRYFRSGLETEPRVRDPGTIALGQRSRLSFVLARNGNHAREPYSALELIAAPVYQAAQTVAVYLNGQWAGAGVLMPGAGPVAHRIKVRPGLLHEGENTLELRWGTSQAPIELGLGPDLRRISAQLYRVVFIR